MALLEEQYTQRFRGMFQYIAVLGAGYLNSVWNLIRAVLVVRKVIVSLLREPAFGAAAESRRQVNGHLGRYPTLAVYEFGKREARHAKGCRRIGNSQS